MEHTSAIVEVRASNCLAKGPITNDIQILKLRLKEEVSRMAHDFVANMPAKPWKRTWRSSEACVTANINQERLSYE
jgi:hypothetical protein